MALDHAHALVERSAPRRPSLEDLYRAHAVKVARWAMKLAGPESDLEDIVHEVFVVVQEKLPTFRGDAPITTWLYRITENVVRQHRRKWARSAELDEEDDRFANGSDPEREAHRQRVRAAVRGTLDDLPADYREVLLLGTLARYSAKEIAEEIGTSPSNVWVRLHRARRMFIERFTKRHPGLDLLPALLIIAALLSVGASAIARFIEARTEKAKPVRSIRYRAPEPPPMHGAIKPASAAATTQFPEEEESTMRVVLPAAVVIAALTSSEMAQAEPEEAPVPETRISYAQKTIIHFDGSKVDGRVERPEGLVLLGKKTARFGVLVRVRTDFRPELLRSVDQL